FLSRGINAFLISLPRSVLTGMFCKLGLLLCNRPVTATAWPYVVCTLPVFRLINSGSASTYVDFSLVSSRYMRISSTILFCTANFNSTSSPVAYWPDLVFFAFGSSFSFSNSTSPNCRGEERLNRTPAWLYTLSSLCFASLSNSTEYDFRKSTSTLIPSYSMLASTFTKG